MNEEALSMAVAAMIEFYFILILQLTFIASLCDHTKQTIRRTNSIRRIQKQPDTNARTHMITHYKITIIKLTIACNRYNTI